MTATAAWVAAGRPEPDWQGKARTPKPTPTTRPGICALTGQPGNVWPLTKVTSTLTTLDRFPHRNIDPQGIALGPAAAWALRLRAQMQIPHALTGPTFGPVDPPELFAALTTLPDQPLNWIGVPQSRQKHLLAWAQPGTVRVDDENLRWTRTDVDLLRLYQWLRDNGFGETALAEPIPRAVLLTKLSAADKRTVIERWAELTPWRDHQAYLDVAARATRQPKEK